MKTLKKRLSQIGLLIAPLFVLTGQTSLYAQWNPNTFVNLEISSLPTADMQTVSTTDGKTWIAFYHENAGNYDMRAQLIDANGYKLLGPDGMLVSNQSSGTATFVFNVCVDASNNLIIGCQDERTGSMSAYLYKISQAGTHLWSPAGVALGGGLAPYPAVLSNGETVVAWNETATNTLNLQKITTTGTLAWTTPVQVKVGTTATTRGQVVPNTGGKFTLVYQKMGYGVSTTLYAQHFNSSGTSLYAPLQIGSLTTSGARYYSVASEGDTTYCGYYAASGNRFNSYLQRINPDGTIPYGMNGSNFNTSTSTSDSYQMTTNIALSPGSPYVWSVCTFSNPNQTQYGVYIQKFLKTNGNRQFTDGAKVVYPITPTGSTQSGGLALVADNPMFMSYDGNYVISATRLDASGNFAWPSPLNKVELSSTTASLSNPKGRYGFTADGPNRCIGIWTETRSANELGYAQGISIGGLIGIRVATQGNVPAAITTPAGTLQMVDTVFPTTASQAVTWSIVQGSGNATITPGGLVTATVSGTVYARAVAVQDVTVRDSLLINISGQAPTAPAVITLAATNIQPNTATINGSVAANGSNTTVSFEWGTTLSYGSTIAANPATVTGNTSTPVLANLTGLAMNTLYHFRCKGVNGIGTNYGADLTFSTGCNIPAGAAGPITGPANVCVNATGQVYSVAPVTNATGYQWTVPSGATIVSGQNTTTITVNFTTGSGTVSVYGTNVCSAGTPANLAVTVLPFPVPTIMGTSNICLGSGLYTYSTETGMNNYTWTVSSGGAILSGAGTAAIQVQWNVPGAQTVSVSYSNAGNCAATQPTVLPVNVNDLPGVAGVITGTPELCAGTSAVAYSVAPVTNAGAYVWTLPAGATIASGNLTSSITVDYSAAATSGDILVVGNNTCGNGPPSPAFPVTVHPVPPTPTVTAIGPELTSSAPAGNQWYYTDVPGGTGVPIPGATGQNHTALNNGYYWTIVTLNGCSSERSEPLFVIVEGIPSATDARLKVSPVPNQGAFHLSLMTGRADCIDIRVIGLLGGVIHEERGILTNGVLEKDIDLRPVEEGVYTLVVTSRTGKWVWKIVVTR